MVTDVPTIAAPPSTTTSAAGGDSPGFDERWAAWQANGAAHDRAVRRKMAFAAPILLFVAAVVMYALFGR
jgi:small-conductance mechanosensitive channel